MTANQDIYQKFREYDSDDRQILIELLHEYSQRLLTASRILAHHGSTIDRKEWLEKIISSPLFILLFCVSLSYLFWAFLFGLYDVPPLSDNSPHSYYKSIDFHVKALCSSVVLFPVILIFFLKSQFFYSFFQANLNDKSKKIEADLLERDARMTASQLESAMRLTVEIADQVETNLARKLELDLRVSDASHSLEYYYSVVSSRPKPIPKPKKSLLKSFLEFFQLTTKTKY